MRRSCPISVRLTVLRRSSTARNITEFHEIMQIPILSSQNSIRELAMNYSISSDSSNASASSNNSSILSECGNICYGGIR